MRPEIVGIVLENCHCLEVLTSALTVFPLIFLTNKFIQHNTIITKPIKNEPCLRYREQQGFLLNLGKSSVSHLTTFERNFWGLWCGNRNFLDQTKLSLSKF